MPRSCGRKLAIACGLLTLALLMAGAARLPAAEPSSAAERAARVKAELKSDDPAVRRAAIRSLVHSDLSAGLLAEMRAALDDRDGEVRSTAATAIGNLGAAAVPAIPQL